MFDGVRVRDGAKDNAADGEGDEGASDRKSVV